METLPKGLLKKVIDEGYPPPEAMKEAWRRVKMQQKRYATRMSYGGGYPLGYTGRNKPRKRKPHKIPFNQWVKAVEREFDLVGVYPKWSGFTAKKLYKVYAPKKAAEKLILESKRRKNPSKGYWVYQSKQGWSIVKRKPKKVRAMGPYATVSDARNAIQKLLNLNPVISGTFAGIVDNNHRRKNPVEQFLNDSESIRWIKDVHLKNIKYPPFKSFILQGNEDYPDLIKLYSKKEPLHTDSPIFSITGKAIYDNPRHKKRKKNPIAIYNPPEKQKLLYGRAYIPVIRGIKTNGKYKGERYEHKFSKNEVSIYGNPDGSLTVKSNNHLRLWNYDKDI